ncbi:MAG: hypothetical protein ACI9JN_001333 [Bacteroidia bacterium]
MSRLVIFISLFAFGWSNVSFAQLVLTNSPKEGTFLPRNLKTNTATFELMGYVTDNTASAIRISVSLSGTQIINKHINLAFSKGRANFSHKITLPSGKYVYKVKYTVNGTTTYTEEADNILVGDVYLIQGQSNSVAANYGGGANTKFDTSYNDDFLRSYGTSSNNGNLTRSDTFWYSIEPDRAYWKGSVGQWGAVMGKQLLDSFNVPICMLNGGVGGTRITSHVPNASNPESLSTIYGRLLYRVRKAKLENNIRGILYFQGESDGGNAQLHDTLFRQVYGAWRRDFPDFEKLYVIQVRSGCGGPSLQLREVQRNFEFVLDKCQTVSANGLNNHDGCHYGFVDGYELLGVQMAALIGRDRYNSGRENIDPPNIKTCYFSNAAQTEITLNMHREDVIAGDNLFYQLFRIEGDPTVSVINGVIRNNKVVLTLNRGTCKPIGLTYDGLSRKRPWVKGGTGMGLITFYNLPIEREPIDTQISICKGEQVWLGNDSLDGCKYSWKWKATGKVTTSAKLYFKHETNQEYLYTIEYNSSVCNPIDSVIFRVLVDPIKRPSLPNQKVICSGEKAILKADSTGYDHFEWHSTDTITQEFTTERSSKGRTILHALSKQKCLYVDTVHVKVLNPVISLPSAVTICPNTDTVIEVANGFKHYKWNGQYGQNIEKLTAGNWQLEVEDSFGCTASDSMVIEVFSDIGKLNIERLICNDAYSVVHKPKGLSWWRTMENDLGDSVLLFANSKIPMHLRDSNSCEIRDTLVGLSLPLPVFNLGGDTAICTGDSVELMLPDGMLSYKWNNNQIKGNHAVIKDSGRYEVRITDINQCSFADSIWVAVNQRPALNEFYDTIICKDSVWTTMLNSDVSYWVNATQVSGSYTFEKEGSYDIEASNGSCSSTKTIEVKWIDCNLGIRRHDITGFRIYPNPAHSYIHIVFSGDVPLTGRLFSLSGKQVQVMQVKPGDNQFKLPNLSSGIYMLTLDGSVVRLMVK